MNFGTPLTIPLLKEGLDVENIYKKRKPRVRALAKGVKNKTAVRPSALLAYAA